MRCLPREMALLVQCQASDEGVRDGRQGAADRAGSARRGRGRDHPDPARPSHGARQGGAGPAGPDGSSRVTWRPCKRRPPPRRRPGQAPRAARTCSTAMTACRDDRGRYVRPDGNRAEGTQAEACAAVLEAEDDLLISAGTAAEALIAAARRSVGAEMRRLIDGQGFEVVSVTPASARRDHARALRREATKVERRIWRCATVASAASSFGVRERRAAKTSSTTMTACRDDCSLLGNRDQRTSSKKLSRYVASSRMRSAIFRCECL